MDGNCADAEALSKGANQAGVTDLDGLKEIAKNSTFEAQRNDKKGKPMVACRSCAEVQKQLGITDIVGCSKK